MKKSTTTNSGCAATQATSGKGLTAAEINALPERVRLYVHHLETVCDPQFILQENWRLGEENEALQIMYRKAADSATPAPAAPAMGVMTNVRRNKR